MSSTRFKVTTHVFQGQHIRHYTGATRNREEDIQYLEAKQYTPLSNDHPRDGDMTILNFAATSFPKEMYEPFYDELLSRCESRGLRIRSIWAADRSDHGASGILNEHTQGDDPSLFDPSLDVLNMINTYRDQMTLPLVGIGHSMGGTSMFHLALIHPRLFATLIAVDPAIGPATLQIGFALIHSASKRPDLWASRQEAEAMFRSVKPLKKWDSRVMDKWLQYGLRETPTRLYPEPGKVTLRTTKAVEAWTYGRSWFDALPSKDRYVSEAGRIKYPDGDELILTSWPFYRPETLEAWGRLPSVRSSVFYIFPDESPMSTPKLIADKMAQTGTGRRGSGGEATGMTAKAIISSCGHLVAFEKPHECAEAASQWLEKGLKEWETRRKYEREHRDNRSIDQIAQSKEWIERAKKKYNDFVAETKAKM